MADREKVIRGLEACACDMRLMHYEDCPYHTNKVRSITRMMRDVLALLKEQEARLVTVADFENNPGLDDGGHLNVWKEYKDGSRCGWDTIIVNDARAFTDLRRYWTSRPTPEQMREMKWEES
jgi:hypothetical protein